MKNFVIIFAILISASSCVHKPDPYPEDVDWDYIFSDGNNDFDACEDSYDPDCPYYEPYYY